MPWYHELRVRYADTDAQGLVFFANYLTYFDEAMTAWMAHAGVSYADMVASGVDFVYADAHVAYRGSARFGDVLHIRARLVRVGTTSFTTAYAIHIDPDAAPIVTGELVHVCVDTAHYRPVQVPEALRALVEVS